MLNKPAMPLPPMDEPHVLPGLKNLRKSLFDNTCRAPLIFADAMEGIQQSEAKLKALGHDTDNDNSL